MMKITIKTTLSDSQIQGLYQLYLFQNEYCKGTKKEFIAYCKNQVLLNGCDEFLLSTNMEEYEELSMGDVEQLMKWKLI